MSESTKPTQYDHGPAGGAGDQPHSKHAAKAVGFQMQPDKQMLAGEACVNESDPSAAGANQMPSYLLSTQHHTVVNVEHERRVALMVTPQPSHDVMDQAWEAVSTIRAILKQQPVPMTVTMQTVYVRAAEDVPAFRKLFEAYHGVRMPTTSFIVQPPCEGQALAIEAWAIGGDDVDVQFSIPDVVTVSYKGLRWIYIAGIPSPQGVTSAYTECKLVLDEIADKLKAAGANFEDVTRVWLYQGGITRVESDETGQEVERYRELNRARTDFFEHQQAAGHMPINRDGSTCYPASTGIGMAGGGLAIGCMALQTDRKDVRLQPLENPRQTSAFDYAQRFSAKSPKFCRAMAVKIGDYVTTWISGTASILDSESVHVGDIQKQTEQSIDNIERLISAENFERHGLTGGGAKLTDLAKVRVYVKRLEDYEKCRSVCEHRLGAVPIIYAQADICRSELLVEIEGVAFSQVRS